MKNQNNKDYRSGKGLAHLGKNGPRVLWIVLIIPLLVMSCGTSVNLVKQGSVFSGTNLLGISTKELVAKYGKPFSTSVEKVDGKTVEHYYYVEIVREENAFLPSKDISIAVTTRFVFHDGVLVKQENNIDFESQEIQRLKQEVRRNN